MFKIKQYSRNYTCYYISQKYIRERNKEFEADIINVTPDADAEIDVELIKKFNIPLCPDCGSDLLKPQVLNIVGYVSVFCK